MANGDLVTIQLEFSGERDEAEPSGIDLLRIEDGKIVHMHLFASNPDDEDLFRRK